MYQEDFDEEWEKLCEECDAAREAHFNARKAAHEKLIQIRQSSKADPNYSKFTQAQRTFQAWEKAKKRLDDYLKEDEQNKQIQY